jgi:uncharacterized protein YdeI (YjbR/CyaY-like superfamily)
VYKRGVPKASKKPELPIHRFDDQAAWEAWLDANHEGSPGVRLKFAKKHSAHETVDYAGALEVALCFGWIDGQVGRFDEDYYLQRFTPRTKRSKWSQVNVEKTTALIESGRMRPAGLAAVEAARADGRWDAAYPPASRATVPGDLQAALDAAPDAAAFFAGLTGSPRYAFLYRLHHVTDPARRSARIADYIERLSARRTLED